MDFETLFKQLSKETQRAIVPALELFLQFEANFKAKAKPPKPATGKK